MSKPNFQPDKQDDPQEDGLPDSFVAALRETYGADNLASGETIPDDISRDVLTDAAAWLKSNRRSSAQPVENVPANRSHSGRHRWAVVSIVTVVTAALLIAVRPVGPDSTNETMIADSDFSGLELQLKTDDSASPDIGWPQEDIDRNGEVNILDAFALAKTIQSGFPTSPQWDVNQDGRTDQDDVHVVAMRAVTL